MNEGINLAWILLKPVLIRIQKHSERSLKMKGNYGHQSMTVMYHPPVIPMKCGRCACRDRTVEPKGMNKLLLDLLDEQTFLCNTWHVFTKRDSQCDQFIAK